MNENQSRYPIYTDPSYIPLSQEQIMNYALENLNIKLDKIIKLLELLIKINDSTSEGEWCAKHAKEET